MPTPRRARNRNARLRPNSSQSISNPIPPSSASHGQISVAASVRHRGARNPVPHALAADATPLRPHPAASANTPFRDRPSAPAPSPARPRKIAEFRLPSMVNGSGADLSVSTRMLAGSVPLSTGTFTVPTVPACTSQRRKRFRSHPAQNIRDQQRRRQFIFHRAAAGLKPDAPPSSALDPRATTTSGPSLFPPP